MRVSNDPANHLKRSHNAAPNDIEQETQPPRKRTAADFRDAVIDDHLYVTFPPTPKNGTSQN